MIHIVGASSLKRALDDLDEDLQNALSTVVTAIPSLSLNPNVADTSLRLDHLLERGYLKNQSNLVLWHDLLNNSLTKHHTNKDTAIEPSDLANLLVKYKPRIAALVYCQREGAPYAFDELRDEDFVIIRVTKNLVSRKNSQNEALQQEYASLHPNVRLEQKSLLNIIEKRHNLKALSQNTRRPTKRPSQQKRKLKRLRRQALQN